jgi:polyhydroxybutyrate depolymerase
VKVIRLALLVWICACSSSRAPVGGAPADGSPAPAPADGSPAPAPADGSPAPAPSPGTDGGGGRPFQLKVPAGYDGHAPVPLVILLHGYGSTGMGQATYFRLPALADARGFLLAAPDGTPDATGRRFWNATDACCDFANVPVDDVAYVSSIIDDVSARYSVDPRRIYLVGHSNGGFMSHRAACDLSPRIAAIVSLAGAVWKDPARCQPTSPVAVLEVHGDADNTVRYDGGAVTLGAPAYPSASDTVATWAAKNGCGSALTPGRTLDLITSQTGEETQTAAYAGCRAAVELWTIRGGVHVPRLTATWPEAIYEFLSAHPKP